jgi:hypothetical protein
MSSTFTIHTHFWNIKGVLGNVTEKVTKATGPKI